MWRAMTVIFLLACSGLGFTQTPTEMHLQETAIGLMKQKKWSEALVPLNEAWASNEHSMTAYLLAVSYSRLKDSSETLRAAEAALGGKPPLADTYRRGAQKLCGWARGIDAGLGPGGTFGLEDKRQGTQKDLTKAAAFAEQQKARDKLMGVDTAAYEDAYRAAKMEVELQFAGCGLGPESACRAQDKFEEPTAPEVPYQ